MHVSAYKDQCQNNSCIGVYIAAEGLSISMDEGPGKGPVQLR